MNLEEMKVQFDAIRKDVLASLEEVKTLKELDQIRVQQLGKKGPITEVLKNIKNLANEEKPKVGALANELRSVLEEKIASVKEILEAKALEEALQSETIDVTMPGRPMNCARISARSRPSRRFLHRPWIPSRRRPRSGIRPL